MKIAFIHNFASHYTVGFYEQLAAKKQVDFYFFSRGDEWYWQTHHGVASGNFRHEYLPGFNIGRTKVTPKLFVRLLGRRYDVFIKCINGRFVLPMVYCLARIKRKPFILWTGIWMRLQTPFHRFAFPLVKWIYENSDAIVVYGSHVRQYLVEEGISPHKIFIAPHATDNELYRRYVPAEETATLRRELRIQDDEDVVLYLGRLEAIKGLDYLIRGFGRMRNARAVLVLAGEGSQRSELEMLAHSTGLSERIRFSGYVHAKDSPRYYAMAKLFVLPSISMPYGKELWGIVINEAMNQGLPIVATDAVGAVAGGLVKNGFNGIVVPQRNSDALATAIQDILKDSSLHKLLSQNSLATIETWTHARMACGFCDAIDYVSTKGYQRKRPQK